MSGARRLGRRGQSTTEFALTLGLIAGFVLLFTQVTLVFGFGNYAHYATFMAARALLSGGNSKDDQTERATSVVTRMLKKSEGESGVDRFPSIAKGVGGAQAGATIGEVAPFDPVTFDLSWREGVRYTFRSRIFLIPFAGSSGATGGGGEAAQSANSLELTTESFLGREPTSEECSASIGATTGALYDNGC